MAMRVINGQRPQRPPLGIGCFVKYAHEVWVVIERCWSQESHSRLLMSHVTGTLGKIIQDLGDLLSSKQQDDIHYQLEPPTSDTQHHMSLTHRRTNREALSQRFQLLRNGNTDNYCIGIVH
jgi:hypothetical protein